MSEPRGAVLGVWDGHDASVSLVVDGTLVFALSEERPSRKKRYSGFPARALERAVAWAARRGLAITDVALAGRWGRAPLRLLEPLYARSAPQRDSLSRTSAAIRGWENATPRVPLWRNLERRLGLLPVLGRLHDAVGAAPRLHTVPHHEAHAWSALQGATGAPALVVTWDAYGEGVALTARPAEQPWAPTARHGVDVGLAELYGAVTQALGFREGDEGKVMGLAAHGDPDVARDRFVSLFTHQKGVPRLRRALDRRSVRRLVAGIAAHDAAAALQATTEALAVAWVREQLRAHGAPRRLLLAGGLFANVKVNQALASLPESDGLFVFPNMTDGGLSAGAALRVAVANNGGHYVPLGSALLGDEPAAAEMRRLAEGAGLPYRRLDDPARALAEHLLAGRVVCRYTGRDEFGPRALGNRSVLFAATQPALGDRVGEALRRPAFMPFGPLLRAEDLWEVTATPLGAEDLAYMTIAVDARPAFAGACPTAVHVDDTARPQVVTAASDPALHASLSRYRAAGGPPAVINTSFNLHGEPIVHRPEDALRSFRRSELDVLLLDDHELRAPAATDRRAAPEIGRTTEAPPLELTMIRCSTLLLRWGAFTALTDPWFGMHMRGLPVFRRPGCRPEDLPPLDAVLVSHLHPDHWDEAAMDRLRTPPRRVLLPPDALPLVRPRPGLDELAHWSTARFGDVVVTSVPANHTYPAPEEINFVLELPGWGRVFFGGDTRFDEGQLREIARRFRPFRLALLPVGGTRIFGRRTVMNPEDARVAAGILGAETVVPIHEGGLWMSVPPASLHPGRCRHLARALKKHGDPARYLHLREGASVTL